MYDKLSDYLSSRKIKFFSHYSMAKVSSIKAGGLAEFYVIPDSANDFIAIIDYLYNRSMPCVTVGGVTNTLFASDMYRGTVLSTRGMRTIRSEGGLVVAECGASLASVMSYAARIGLGGAEQLWLIPGTVGGAVRGNAGAHGLEMADIIEFADIYFPKSAKVCRLCRDELEFSYRTSLAKKHRDAYVMSVGIRLSKACLKEIRERRRYFLKLRAESQPMGSPSLGCVFKRVEGVSAGYYIDRAGLKGFAVGGAKVSEKHAGFIINAAGADHHDVASLVLAVESIVGSRLGIALNREIEIV